MKKVTLLCTLQHQQDSKIYVECIIGKDGKRKYLIDIDNNNGESLLFLTALSWQKQIQ